MSDDEMQCDLFGYLRNKVITEDEFREMIEEREASYQKLCHYYETHPEKKRALWRVIEEALGENGSSDNAPLSEQGKGGNKEGKMKRKGVK